MSPIETLDRVFSEYIRLRDSDSNGMCQCFTCSYRGHWKTMDAGHGIVRQHMATRFDERNVHTTCIECNRFKGGEPEKFALAVDQKYGLGTWAELYRLSKGVCKRSKPEIEAMVLHYRAQVAIFKNQKGL